IAFFLPLVLTLNLLQLDHISKVVIPVVVLSSGAICLYLTGRYWRHIRGAKWIVIGTAFLVFAVGEIVAFLFEFLYQVGSVPEQLVRRILETYRLGQTFLFPTSLLIYVAFWLRETVIGERKKAFEVVRVTREKDKILQEQNIRLEEEVKNRTAELKTSLESLKAAQAQLIHAEKMASLGELTAGIAHEIQNPLNFVNNFSEVSRELIDEMKEELKNGDYEEVTAIAEDLKQNLGKINHHGNRAGNIVKGMLQHSRGSDGKKEPTDLNALADEYLRLAYHGLRAKDKSFNAVMETDFDESIGKVEVVPQDIGRVILNLVTNAFHAVSERKSKEPEGYEPTVWVATRKTNDGVELAVRDNGGGIPDKIKEKIFQPFFTTKPTGEGTGLGLSMSYDIVTKGHGGDIQVRSEPGAGSEFTIIL
ncbi:MAG: ATP-binding protein, partial [Robiginitalea sp.]|nr:ATP-binding protein [Robiginitalea sp.]